MYEEAKNEAPMYSGKWWSNEIDMAEEELEKKWRKSGRQVISRYLNEKDDSDDQTAGDTPQRKYNVFWANTQILKSALYASPPKPQVTRQNGDAKDDVARTAALMLERMLNIGLDEDESDVHNSLKAAVEDRLLPGLGQTWIRYEHDEEEYEIPAAVDPFTGQVLVPAQMATRIIDERAALDYVQWDDFVWSPARTWDEVWWCARRCWYRKKKFVKLFGPQKWEDLKNTIISQEKEHELPKGFRKGKAMVFEVWCEASMKVYWVSPTMEECLKTVDDPLGLDNFFPCPKPLLATHSNRSLIPRPDYAMVQDQYEELDILNDRISTLTRALRLVGVYDKNQSELAQMITGGEFAMIPVDNWAVLAEQGGIRGVVDWFPIEQCANVLEKLGMQRQAVIAQIYELTSISDIMRGASNPRETAQAQKLKAQYSSVRLQLTQQDVALFVRRNLRLKAEVIARHFQPETIINQSQIQYTESGQYAQQAVALIKNFRASEYRLEVSEESLSMADYTAEREMRIELLTALGQFFSQSSQMVAGMPGSMPYILKMTQWVIASFRGSSDIESVIDEAVDAAMKNPPKPPEEKPDTSVQVAQIKAQAEIQKTNMTNEKDKEVAALDAKSREKIELMKQVGGATHEEMRLNANRGVKEMEINAQKEITTAEVEAKEAEKVDLSPVQDAVATLAEQVDAQVESLASLQETMQELLKEVSRPRRRIPVRDDNGDIVEVREE